MTFAVISLYWLIALTGIPPLIALLLWWRKRRRDRADHCAQCGYDLRASSGVCPECGEPIVA